MRPICIGINPLTLLLLRFPPFKGELMTDGSGSQVVLCSYVHVHVHCTRPRIFVHTKPLTPHKISSRIHAHARAYNCMYTQNASNIPAAAEEMCQQTQQYSEISQVVICMCKNALAPNAMMLSSEFIHWGTPTNLVQPCGEATVVDNPAQALVFGCINFATVACSYDISGGSGSYDEGISDICISVLWALWALWTGLCGLGCGLCGL